VKILVVRRDNIGDLVLTTPMLHALRERFPGARIEVLTNTYNAPVLDGFPDVDRVHAYTKAKHRPGESPLGAFAALRARLGQFLALRAERFDLAILASPGYSARAVRLGRLLAPGSLAAFVPPGRRIAGVEHGVEDVPIGSMHHVEETLRILRPFGVTDPPGPTRLGRHRLTRPAGAPLRFAVHVSARKPSSRWPEERFPALLARLHERLGATFRLLWSPGAEDDPRHPGDDGKASRILAASQALPVEAVPTHTLGSLVDAIAGCDAIACSDGGAMHLAAALGLPVACLFGDSIAARWHPWGVDYRLLQPPSRDARDVDVEAFAQACEAISPRPS
jgi:heptosyltransferase III